ncbi:hypothetical protein SAMN02799631_06515 [Methylobacterium sp. 174MFSha1.1]|uniref:hypothetical protein n=1 Tax=Methylobacterium sp. 174MFSha1.1 TaxID=1502749 RepID=UPI0008E82E4B|nr:hypothetical protein [Methylobacterium sp. 174MFSha1.1]SFV16768.1 hypothetical protein SAMN02799631_06515 [Methylobacterium sp. 174MFSha1.1]
MLGRSVTVALVLAAAPAAAKSGAEPPGSEVMFPAKGDRFLLAVRGPAGPGRERFARVYASPDRGTAYWTTSVTCGTVDVRNGRERIEAQGAGSAWLDKGKLAGTWSPVGGGYGDAQMRTWSVDSRDGLDVTVSMSGPCPGRGTGDLSSGD